jgi:hypothetical protein
VKHGIVNSKPLKGLVVPKKRDMYPLRKRGYIHVTQGTTMTIRQTTIAAAFALAAIGPARAEGLKPLQGEVIDLGDVSGVAYYTVERDGFRVVATLAKKDEDAVPVRVVAVLAPGQDLQASRHGARPQGGRGGRGAHELTEGRLIGDAGTTRVRSSGTTLMSYGNRRLS